MKRVVSKNQGVKFCTEVWTLVRKRRQWLPSLTKPNRAIIIFSKFLAMWFSLVYKNAIFQIKK